MYFHRGTIFAIKGHITLYLEEYIHIVSGNASISTEPKHPTEKHTCAYGRTHFDRIKYENFTYTLTLLVLTHVYHSNEH